MTERVDFYVLASATDKQRLSFACRLTEKAYLRDLTVVLLSDTTAEAVALDDLLWTFNERSFVPHELQENIAGRPVPVGDGELAAPPVQITADLGAVNAADLLVNLSQRLPGGLERFARIAEILDADDERLVKGRERFKAYRELKLPVETHRLDDAAGA